MRPFSILKFFFSLLIWAAFTCPPKSISQEGGQAGAYLRAGVGVRARGLGGAFVAMANDVTAGYWNPAGLAQIAEPQLVGMYSLLSLDRQYNCAAAAYPLGSAGAISLSWVNYRVSNLTGRDHNGEATGEFANGENAFLLSYGKALRPSLALGATAKLLRHDLGKRSANGFGYDAGFLFKPKAFFALGASVQNLRTRISWNNAKRIQETFPLLTRLGAQIKPHSFINLSVDYEMIKRQKGKWHGGAEFFLGSTIGVRAGFDDGAMALGASVTAFAAGKSLALDYGLTPDPIGNNLTHQFAFLLKFNPPRRLSIPDPLAKHDSAPRRDGVPNDEINVPIARQIAQLDSLPPPPVVQETLAVSQPPNLSLPIFFIANVIEVRAPYLIIGAEQLAGLQSGMAVKVFRSLFGGQDSGRYYGLGKALDVSPRYAIIEMQEPKMAAALAVGEKLALKVMP